MPNTKTIFLHFRVTQNEYDRIKNTATARGHSSVASFMRKAVLERDLWLEKTVQEIAVKVREIHKATAKSN